MTIELWKHKTSEDYDIVVDGKRIGYIMQTTLPQGTIKRVVIGLMGRSFDCDFVVAAVEASPLTGTVRIELSEKKMLGL